jgi:hypothetical protein
MYKLRKQFMIHCLYGAFAIIGGIEPAISQKTANNEPISAISQADIFDLSLASDAIAVVKIRKSSRVADKRAASLPSGRKRFLVEATVTRLIRGNRPLPQRITYLIDIAPDSSGRFSKLTGGEAIIFADRVAAFDSELRLVTRDAQLGATPARLSQVQSALAETVAENAPDAITSISGAFNLPGPVPGEGESQFFLATDQRPMSITVSRTPGAAPAWWVALGEVVDQGLAPPKRNSFLWYRLACFLPARLPEDIRSESDVTLHAALDDDYAFIRTELGPCPRTLNPRPIEDPAP